MARAGRVATVALVAMAMVLFLTAAQGNGTVPAPGGITAAAGDAANGEPAIGPAKFAPGFTHGQVAIDGGTIHYVKSGHGPVLLLLHGWPETWWEFHKIMPALAEDHTVIAMDLPGLGGSSIWPDGYDKVTAAERIREAVHRLGYNRIEILAHDLGVSVSYPYVRDHPTEVTRYAVLDAPLAGFGLDDLVAQTWHIKFNEQPYPLTEQLIDNDDVPAYLNYLFTFSFNSAAIDRRTFFRAYADPARRSAGYKYYRAVPADTVNNTTNAQTRRLRQPVLAMGSQYTLGPAVGAWFSALADDVHPVVAPNSGHYIPEENPDFLAACTRIFFAHTPPSRAAVPQALAGCSP
jgi:pimeloyl-ACP methyl ester carboxylesterase